MMCKAVNNQTPGYLRFRFTPRLDVLNYNLRNVEYTLFLLVQIQGEGSGGVQPKDSPPAIPLR